MQINYLQKLTSKPGEYEQSPICRAIELARDAGSPAARYLQNLLSGTNRPVENDLEKAKTRVRQSDSTRIETYRLFNPRMTIHKVYVDPTVPEYDRKAFSQIRLGSHFLKIETGRWARIEREKRLCPCGQIQTGQHVLLQCAFTQSIRARHPRLNFADLIALMATDYAADVARFCRQVVQYVHELNRS